MLGGRRARQRLCRRRAAREKSPGRGRGNARAYRSHDSIARDERLGFLMSRFSVISTSLTRWPPCFIETRSVAEGQEARRSRSMASTGLVLQGGGALGAFEYGALQRLYEEPTFSPD